MTDTDHALEAIERAANGLIPQLGERLARHGLGEIEVADGDLRLRVRGGVRVPDASPTGGTPEAAGAEPAQGPSSGGSSGRPSIAVGSPAVGFFVYADGLGPGLAVGKGDPLGHVEMLGVRHDVRAPRGGTVRHLVAESGEAVEYGQVVVEMDTEDGSR
ncbi:MAG TPA: biotin/lipoyl-containing protein [Candidatus Limnocylindrales bacterium]|jgi:biotin carboxyl carrier protein|nr:biotin/lipoyl-containing protein [Candidatus Limnocylindrales bacterium]